MTHPCSTAHVTSVISALVGVFAAAHPGWTEPAWVEQLIPVVAGLVTVGVQSVHHLHFHRKAKP